MPSLLVAVVVVIFAMIMIGRIARVVPQQNAWVVERLGKYSATLNAGFHILVPFLDTVRYKHSLKEVALDVPEQVCITRDNVQVAVDGVLYFKVLDPARASCRSRMPGWSSGSASTQPRSTPASISWCRSSIPSATSIR